MPSDSSFNDFLSRLNAGEQQQAAEQLYHRFARRLAALAARRLTGPFLRRVSPEDVVQSVFATFFRRNDDGEFVLHDWDSLWGLLACITIKRIHRHQERHLAARRDVNRETTPCEDPSWADLQAIDREPEPSDLLIVEELTDQMKAGLSEQKRAVVDLKIAGHTYQEIASQLKISISTVDRVIRRVRDRLEKIARES